MRLILVFGLMAWLTGCGGQVQQSAQTSDRSTAVKLQLNWFPEVEHGGFYAARSQGYYNDAGIDVMLTPGGPGTNVWAMVDRGRVEFGLVNADRVLLARAQGAKIKAILAPFQHSPRCILVHAESGIESLNDLSNLTLAMDETALFSQYMQQTLPLTNVRIVPYSGSLGPFLVDPNYATQGYVFSEPIIARQKGVEVRSLMLSEIGFDPYTSVVVCREELITTQPELVGKFVNSTVKGWLSYLHNPQQTNPEIRKDNPEIDAEVLDQGAKQLAVLVDANLEGESLKPMELIRWEQLKMQLQQTGTEFPEDFDVGAVFTNEFLKTGQE